MIPPTSTDITRRRDLLDHDAIDTVSEKDLNTCLSLRFARTRECLRFARTREVLDADSRRVRLKTDTVGKAIEPLGWLATTNRVSP